jgi:hypothetical protein
MTLAAGNWHVAVLGGSRTAPRISACLWENSMLKRLLRRSKAPRILSSAPAEWRLRYSYIKRLFAGQRAVASTAFMLVAAIVGLIVALTDDWREWPGGGAIVVTSFGLLVGFLVVVGWAAKRVMPPEEYAELHLGGRLLPDALRIISIHISEAMRMFEASAPELKPGHVIVLKKGLGSPSERLFEDLGHHELGRTWLHGALGWIWGAVARLGRALSGKRQMPASWSGGLDLLARFGRADRSIVAALYAVARCHEKLLRIDAMIRRVAKDNRLEEHKLKDSLLFFDPVFHSEIQRIYIDDLGILLEQLEHLDGERIQFLATECRGATALARRAIEFHKQLRSLPDLLPLVGSIAGARSLSIGMRRYVRAVATIGQESVDALERLKTLERHGGEGAFDLHRVGVLHQAFTALSLLAWQSRANLGCDVRMMGHRIVKLPLLERMAELSAPVSPAVDKPWVERLRVVAELQGDGAASLEAEAFEPFEPAHWEVVATDPERFAECLDALEVELSHVASAEDRLSRSVKLTRDDVYTESAMHFRHWIDGVIQTTGDAGRPSVIIAVHGFSATVREVLLKMLKDQRRISELAARARGGIDIKIFLVSTSLRDAIEARKMTNFVRYYTRNAKPPVFVTSGDLESLRRLVSRETAVLGLLGAEIYDKKECILLNRHAGVELIDFICKELPESPENNAPFHRNHGRYHPYMVAVLVDETKRVDDIHSEHQMFAHHISQIEVVETKDRSSVLLIDGCGATVDGLRSSLS